MDCNEEGDSAPPKYWLISFPYSRGIISRGLPRDFVLLIGNTIASTKSSVKDVDLMLSVLTPFFFFFFDGHCSEEQREWAPNRQTQHPGLRFPARRFFLCSSEIRLHRSSPPV